MSLKPDNIYVLPDGVELIARANSQGGYTLHNPLLGAAAAPTYLVTPSGEVLSWSRRTSWKKSDLQDTGKSSLPQIKRIVLL
ncbi:MAG TPA: hypothetical protein VGQ39_06830 [Pyrinomonadaceae bacterium]|nr:hypothetical protein [Pyrinomonadaceae bacterium]